MTNSGYMPQQTCQEEGSIRLSTANLESPTVHNTWHIKLITRCNVIIVMQYQQATIWLCVSKMAIIEIDLSPFKC